MDELAALKLKEKEADELIEYYAYQARLARLKRNSIRHEIFMLEKKRKKAEAPNRAFGRWAKTGLGWEGVDE